MNHDVISMAREAGFHVGDQFVPGADEATLERFYQLVAAQAAAAEREACAKLVESQTISGFLEDMPDMIRARGTA